MVWVLFTGGTGTMEQWFDQLLGPGVPVILEQWNNGLTNFWGRGSYSPVDPKPPAPLSVDCGKSSASDSRTSTPV